MDLNHIDKLVSRFSNFLQILALIALVILTSSVIYEVVARSILDRPTIWSIEVVTYMISIVAFLGSAHVLRINRHLEINLLTSLLNHKLNKIMNFFSNFIALCFCLITFYYGLKLTYLSYILGVVSESELRIPQWLPQITVPIGFFALSLEFLIRLIKSIKNIKKSD